MDTKINHTFFCKIINHRNYFERINNNCVNLIYILNCCLLKSSILKLTLAL